MILTRDNIQRKKGGVRARERLDRTTKQLSGLLSRLIIIIMIIAIIIIVCICIYIYNMYIHTPRSSSRGCCNHSFFSEPSHFQSKLAQVLRQQCVVIAAGVAVCWPYECSWFPFSRRCRGCCRSSWQDR